MTARAARRVGVAVAAVIAVTAGAATASAADDDDRRTVRLQAGPADQLVVETLDRLEDGDVVIALVTDAEPGARGQVRQCRLEVTRLAACRNPFPILFDDDGRATFQYQLLDDGACGADAACVIAAGTDAETALAFTVFGAPAPAPPTVRLSPDGPVEPGTAVRVDVSQLPAGSAVRAAFCDETCGRADHAVAGEDGSASLDVTVGARCGSCGITVVGGASSTQAPVTFVAAPSARYDAVRLIAGLAAAAVFLFLAWRLIVTVDWRPPSEAAVPDVDL